MKFFLTLFTVCLITLSCNKDGHHDCYDESLVHDDLCTADCPGFMGCDGNKYCNECEAARHGIGPM